MDKLEQSFDFENGEIILIDKPFEWTSFDVVKKVRGITKIKKVGHCGTLDPLATGLLILATKKKTKQIEGIQGQEKVYTGIIEIGKTTPSYDLETEFDKNYDISGITNCDLEKAAKELTGAISQVPPVFSAVKVDGKRAYKSAREGKKVEIKPREVFISEFSILKAELPEVHFRIVCSKGTYIRTMANDFGIRLNNGAYLKALRRENIGDYSVENAMTIQEFQEAFKNAKMNEGLSFNQ